MSALTAVSLFAGVGGIDLAMERAGVRVTSAVEINNAARGVLHDRFPNTALHEDVTKVNADELRSDGFVPDRGILTGGFPCQDLSTAGHRAGMDRGSGTRSALYWEIDRLVAELSPRWVVLENVPGLLQQDSGRAMGAVLGSLAERGYGYAYRVLDAQHFGVPQRRRRVVIVGCFGDAAGPVEVLFEPESRARDSAQIGAARQVAAGGFADRVGAGSGIVATLEASTRGQVSVAGTAGNQVVITWQKVRRSGERDSGGNLPPERWARRDIAATITGHDAGEARANDLVAFKSNASPTARMPITSESPTLTRDADIASHTVEGVRRLTPLEWERLQGFPDHWTATSNGKAQADSPRYQQMGNAVAVPVFEWVMRRLVAVDSWEVAA